MGKKGKNKHNSNSNKKSSNKDNRGAIETKQRKGKNFRKRDANWKAGSNDPVRQTVEADGSKTVVDMQGDGNCLFRSLSDQLFYDYGSGHTEVRSEICDYLAAHQEDFSIFLILDDKDDDEEDASDFESYVRGMREDGEWGGNLELVAAARLYRRDIVVFSADLAAFTIPHGASKTGGPNMLISYHDNHHYNSIRDNAVNKPCPPRLKKQESDDADEKDTNKTLEAVEIGGSSSTGVKRPPKKSAPCPCGSGLRYKKCCWQREKLSPATKNTDGSTSEEETDHIGFRLLKI